VANLEQRIQTVEQSSITNDYTVIVINMAGENVTGFKSGDAVIHRLPGETVAELTERCTQEWTGRVPGGFLMMRSI
jgi:hypothetical protein